jgi:hypothetical protein
MTNASQSTLKYVVDHATTALGVLALWSLGFGDGPPIPSFYHDLTATRLNKYSWESPIRNPYYTVWEHMNEDYRKLEIISDFAARLIADSEDLNPSYARIVSNRLWDLF